MEWRGGGAFTSQFGHEAGWTVVPVKEWTPPYIGDSSELSLLEPVRTLFAVLAL
jgi:hypothetical protein